MDLKKQQPSYFHNRISVLGSVLSVAFFVIIAALFLLDFLTKEKDPFLETVTFLIAPAFLILSLLLIPGGALLERSRRRKREAIPPLPNIDLNNPLHQKWFYVTAGVVTLFLLFTAFGLYRAFEFTESNTFCGRLCHSVMEPEYTAYQRSPHTRVGCAKCHIGYGAEWYVRSKITGLYQVYSTIAKAYSRPIETPLRSLRPARETCEQCHWPQIFLGSLDQSHDYFLPDESNTEWKTRMMVHVGGGADFTARKQGIHWHVTGNNKIYYIATDKKRQTIPWVRVVAPDGKETVFVDKGSPYTAENPPKGEMRLMDCIDCHNRPSHQYKAPAEAVNQAMTHGAIDPSLPFIKREAVNALTGEYATSEDAVNKISLTLSDFYKQKYPQIWEREQAKVLKSIAAIVQVYKANFFPQMKVSWKAYPNNIGHLNSPGCFRCHSGRHQSGGGSAISNTCSSCHDIIAQGPLGRVEGDLKGLDFKHPDTGDADERQGMPCFECHTGENA